jgi:hypothetical protein
MSDEVQAYRQQFEQLSNWSRFYHDAEIRVNTSALAISSISMLAEKFLQPLGADKVGGVNIVGLVIVIVSAAALFSTLGYWRYYEYCDLYAKFFRREYLSKTELDRIHEGLDAKFADEFPIFRGRIWIHAHHAIWMVTQCIFLCIGVWFLIAR